MNSRACVCILTIKLMLGFLAHSCYAGRHTRDKGNARTICPGFWLYGVKNTPGILRFQAKWLRESLKGTTEAQQCIVYEDSLGMSQGLELSMQLPGTELRHVHAA